MKTEHDFAAAEIAAAVFQQDSVIELHISNSVLCAIDFAQAA